MRGSVSRSYPNSASREAEAENVCVVWGTAATCSLGLCCGRVLRLTSSTPIVDFVPTETGVAEGVCSKRSAEMATWAALVSADVRRPCSGQLCPRASQRVPLSYNCFQTRGVTGAGGRWRDRRASGSSGPLSPPWLIYSFSKYWTSHSASVSSPEEIRYNYPPRSGGERSMRCL